MPGAGRYPGLVGDFFVEEFMLEGNGSQKPRKCFGKSRVSFPVSFEFYAFSPHSLTKDMTGKEDNYRGPAVRALCQITDVSLLPPSSHLPLPAFNQGSGSSFACFRWAKH